jgi:tetratricopeptide (TPR) repeat protein
VTRAIEIDPQLANAHFVLGKMMLAAGDTPSAMASFQRGVAINPSEEARQRVQGALQKYKGAPAMAATKPITFDRKRLRKAIREDGVQHVIDQTEGLLSTASNMSEGSAKRNVLLAYAQRVTQEILRAEPRNAAGLNQQGMILRAQGDVAGAVTAFKTATKLNPKSALAFQSLGAILVESGKMEEAAKAQQQAVDLGGETCGTHMNMGMTFLQSSDYSNAIHSFEKAIAIDDDPLHNDPAKHCLMPAQRLALQINISACHYNTYMQVKSLGDLNNKILALALVAYKAAVTLDPTVQAPSPCIEKMFPILNDLYETYNNDEEKVI